MAYRIIQKTSRIRTEGILNTYRRAKTYGHHAKQSHTIKGIHKKYREPTKDMPTTYGRQPKYTKGIMKTDRGHAEF